MSVPKVVGLTLLAVLLLVGLAVGGWRGGWWLQQSAVNHQNHINRSSYEFQTSERQDMEDLKAQVAGLDSQIQSNPQNAEALTAQKRALEDQFCQDAANIQGSDALTPDLTQFEAAACGPTAP